MTLKVKWPKVIDGFYKPMIRQMNLCNGTMYKIISFISMGPFQRLFVGIERKGCFLFSMNKGIHWEYAAEKLGLYESDARIIADWINVQINQEYEQQGNYNERWMENIPKEIKQIINEASKNDYSDILSLIMEPEIIEGNV